MHSSIAVKPFRAQDWGLVDAVDGVSVFQPSVAALEIVEQHGLAVTLWGGDTAVAYLGIKPLGIARAEVWAIIDRHRTLRDFAAIHRIARDYIEAQKVDRLEAFAECDFPAGHVWLRKLGFSLEAPRMRRYLPNGKDCALYALVRGGDGRWEFQSS